MIGFRIWILLLSFGVWIMKFYLLLLLSLFLCGVNFVMKVLMKLVVKLLRWIVLKFFLFFCNIVNRLVLVV